MMILVNSLFVLGIIVGLVGLGVSIWSIIYTRNLYYEEFRRRKNRHVGD